MYRGRHDERSSLSKHGRSNRERLSRSPQPDASGLTASQKRIMEMEEKIRKLDKSLEVTTQKIQSYQNRNERLSREKSETSTSSKSRRRSHSRERSSHRAPSISHRHEDRSAPRRIVEEPDNRDQFRRINSFRQSYEASTSVEKRYEPPDYPDPQYTREPFTFPIFWNQEQNEIRADPVPVYPGCFGDEEEEEERERNARALEDQRQAYEEKKQMEILAREANRIKQKHLKDLERKERDDARKKEDAEKKRKLSEEESRRRAREKKSTIAPKNSETVKSSSSSLSSVSRSTERILLFFKELGGALGSLTYESSSKKTSEGYDEWTTVCHVTNIPKELISATSIGKSTKEKSRNHSVEKFFEKLVNFGILSTNIRGDFEKYKTLPVFLASIMNEFFNEISIYGIQISVTGDRDMSKKFSAFVREASTTFWNRQESVVAAFLKCQTAEPIPSTSSVSTKKSEESSRRSNREADERRAREKRDRERREKERERSREREKEKIRRRAQSNAREYVAPPVPMIYSTIVAPTPTQSAAPAYMTTPYQPPIAPIMNYLQTCVSSQPPQFNPIGPPPPIGQFPPPIVVPQPFQPATPFAPRPDFPVQCFPAGANAKPQPLMGPAQSNGGKKEDTGDLFDEIFK